MESRLKKGELAGIVATSSLELGIDVGSVDQVVLVSETEIFQATRYAGPAPIPGGALRGRHHRGVPFRGSPGGRTGGGGALRAECQYGDPQTYSLRNNDLTNWLYKDARYPITNKKQTTDFTDYTEKSV